MFYCVFKDHLTLLNTTKLYLIDIFLNVFLVSFAICFPETKVNVFIASNWAGGQKHYLM